MQILNIGWLIVLWTEAQNVNEDLEICDRWRKRYQGEHRKLTNTYIPYPWQGQSEIHRQTNTQSHSQVTGFGNHTKWSYFGGLHQMINSQVEVMSNGRFIHGKRFMYERGVWTAINRPEEGRLLRTGYDHQLTFQKNLNLSF